MNIEKEAFKEIEKLKVKIRGHSFSTSPVLTKQYNHELTVSSLNEKIKVQVYFGKKGVKIILQGNKESDLYIKLSSIIFGDSLFIKSKTEIIEPDNYIGSDESGKGDFFGPLTVAAFFVDESIKSELIALDVKDSKLLSDIQINSIAEEIKNIKNVFYEVLVITPAQYNELYFKFGNLNVLLNWAHSNVIEGLLKKITADTVITDKFSNRDLEISTKNKHNINFIQTEKGERFIGVAAASILARNAMNIWFERQKRNGFVLPKGASGEVEQKARQIKNQFGEDKLYDLVKLHFKTFEKIK